VRQSSARERIRDNEHHATEPVSERPLLTVVESPPTPPSAKPSGRSVHGLDWFVFFVADIQTGFGPFVAAYLTAQHWTQVDIGLVLSVAGLVALAGQIPGGAIVDAARSERLVAGFAIIMISIAALSYAAWPIFPIVLGAAILHATASCVLGPAIAAISLGLVGHTAIGERLGRNARFASIGNGIAAAAMGACGYLFSTRAVFFVTALLLVPALFALRWISPKEVDPERAHGGMPPEGADKSVCELPNLLHKRPLFIFGGCMMLFHLANAAMLPLMASMVTTRSSSWAPVLIAACIVVPQIVVALLSPTVGRKAREWGRRRLLLIGFATLPIRGILFATVADPTALVVVQVLDGITAAVLGVMVPLTIADLTRGTGRFNIAQGIVGTMVGVGAALSTSLGGYATDHFGSTHAFLGLASIGVAGFMAVLALMPETRPAEDTASG
jgi:predicted MFS family arabinose efflux permease